MSNITEPDLSNSTTARMVERWGRLNNTPMDMPKVAKTPMAMHDDPDEDVGAEMTEETVENNSKIWTALTPTEPDCTAAATEPTQNSNSNGGPKKDLLLDKTNTALALNEVQTETDEPNKDKEAEPTVP